MSRLQRLVEKTVSLSSMVTTTTSDPIDLDGAESISVQAVVDVDTPAAKAFTADATEDTLSAEGHGFTTGLKGQVTTSDADFPAGLEGTTDYFVIAVDDDTFQLATSLDNALAGTAIDIEDAGTGTHTFTPTALAGGAVKLQKSNDGETWDDVAAATDITQDGQVWLEKDRPTFRWGRLHYTLTAGSLSAENHVLVKGQA